MLANLLEGLTKKAAVDGEARGVTSAANLASNTRHSLTPFDEPRLDPHCERFPLPFRAWRVSDCALHVLTNMTKCEFRQL